MIKAYILVDENGYITIYSNDPGMGEEVIQDDPVIDMSKLVGYDVVIDNDHVKHLVFSEEKYNRYFKEKEKQEQLENANEGLEDLVKEQLLPILSDEQAYTFRYLYPEFEIDKAYEVGERIIYDYKFYKVIMAHTSQADWTPDVAVSLFAEVPDPSIEYPEFKKPYSAETAYMSGDKISFEGNKYISTMDNNVYSPTEYPQGWELVQ
jgi:hypothetical protein